MTAPRPSSGTQQQDRRWRSVIRIFAVTLSLVGVTLLANEVVENVTCTGEAFCSKIHLSTGLWGLAFFGLGLLILQKGDVSLSLQEAASTGTIVRGWFTRAGRASDAAGTKVTTVVVPPPTDP